MRIRSKRQVPCPAALMMAAGSLNAGHLSHGWAKRKRIKTNVLGSWHKVTDLSRALTQHIIEFFFLIGLFSSIFSWLMGIPVRLRPSPWANRKKRTNLPGRLFLHRWPALDLFPFCWPLDEEERPDHAVGIFYPLMMGSFSSLSQFRLIWSPSYG